MNPTVLRSEPDETGKLHPTVLLHEGEQVSKATADRCAGYIFADNPRELVYSRYQVEFLCDPTVNPVPDREGDETRRTVFVREASTLDQVEWEIKEHYPYRNAQATLTINDRIARMVLRDTFLSDEAREKLYESRGPSHLLLDETDLPEGLTFELLYDFHRWTQNGTHAWERIIEDGPDNVSEWTLKDARQALESYDIFDKAATNCPILRERLDNWLNCIEYEPDFESGGQESLAKIRNLLKD